MLIAIEGLDGAGKSSVAQELAARLNGVYARVPYEGAGEIDSLRMSDYRSAERYLLYLQGCAFVAGLAAGSGRVVVADRYTASAHALHLEVPDDRRRVLGATNCPPPDLHVLLTVGEAERLSRLKGRGVTMDPFELRLELDPHFRSRVAHALAAGRPDIVIDTTGVTIVEVVDRLVSMSLDRA